MSAALKTAVALACAVFVGGSASAQELTELRVQIVPETGVSAAGALVALIDELDKVAAETLSSESGYATLRAPRGNYRVRVRRIGFRPYFSEPVAIPRPTVYTVRVESQRVMLAAMVVSAKTPCGRINPDAEMLSLVWDEISKALRASQLTLADVSNLGLSKVYQRTLNPGGAVMKADTTTRFARLARPFGAIDPASLVRDGYVRGNTTDGWNYFGPDEAVLLSPGFAETHCFRIVREADRPGELGLSFEPVKGRRVADIRGVVWLDGSTSELREIDFRYLNAEPLSRFGAGGFTRFRRMPSGAWMVSEWKLRVPLITQETGQWRRLVVSGYQENGGLLVDSR